jgi:hypothetical protein
VTIDDDDIVLQEFTTPEFAARLGLPPGALIISVGMIWFDVLSDAENNTVRVRYRPNGGARPFPLLVEVPLNDRLRRLAAKWRAQAKHPQRRNLPGEAKLLERHADELMRELAGRKH